MSWFTLATFHYRREQQDNGAWVEIDLNALTGQYRVRCGTDSKGVPQTRRDIDATMYAGRHEALDAFTGLVETLLE